MVITSPKIIRPKVTCTGKVKCKKFQETHVHNMYLHDRVVCLEHIVMRRIRRTKFIRTIYKFNFVFKYVDNIFVGLDKLIDSLTDETSSRSSFS
jgi:hypothetical protein